MDKYSEEMLVVYWESNPGPLTLAINAELRQHW